MIPAARHGNLSLLKRRMPMIEPGLIRALRLVVLGGTAAILGAYACAAASKPAAPAPVKASIEARSGSSLSGTATFTEKGGGVDVVVDVSGAPAGTHAVHLHEKGDCSAP